MPEGDTIHKGANILRPLLVGKAIVSARCRWPLLVRDLPGRRVTAVDVRGKHLLLEFDDDSVLRVHLGMEGSWSRFEPDDPVPASRTLGLVLVTKEDMFTCHHPKDVERLERRRLHLHPTLSRLGPDLAAGPVDIATVLARAGAVIDEVDARGGELAVEELLMDQTPASGIGNVFKSETLFLGRVHPFTSAFDVDDATLAALYQIANKLLMAAVQQTRRNTTARRVPELWVYGRAREPCLVCGTPIAKRAPKIQRLEERVTSWCPHCQPAPVPGAPDS